MISKARVKIIYRNINCWTEKEEPEEPAKIVCGSGDRELYVGTPGNWLFCPRQPIDRAPGRRRGPFWGGWFWKTNFYSLTPRILANFRREQQLLKFCKMMIFGRRLTFLAVNTIAVNLICSTLQTLLDCRWRLIVSRFGIGTLTELRNGILGILQGFRVLEWLSDDSGKIMGM